MKYRQEATCSVSTGGGDRGGRKKKTVPKQKVGLNTYLIHTTILMPTVSGKYIMWKLELTLMPPVSPHTHTYTHDHAYLLSNGNDPTNDPGRVCSKSPFS